MIAELGRAQSNAYQNKDKHRIAIMRSTLNNRSTIRESPPQNVQQPKQRGLNAFKIIPINLSLHPKESPYEVWLALWFQRRCLKMLTNSKEWRLESFVYNSLSSEPSALVSFKRYFIWPCMVCDLHFVGPGAYLGPLWVILPTLKYFNCLNTVCFIYGLSIYEIKRICHHTQFFIIS